MGHLMRMICLVAIVALLAAAPALAATSIALCAHAIVSGPQVRLGEVADIAAGGPDSDAEWAAIVVGAAPLPGNTHTIARAQVITHLRKSGADMNAVDLSGARSVAVTRAAAIVSGDELAAAGKAALEAQAPDDVTPEITCSRRPADLTVPEGTVELKAEAGNGPPGGLRTVSIAVLVDGRLQRRALVTYAVKLWADVLVAKAFTARHADLDPAAFAVERRDIALLRGLPLRSPEELAGKRASRAIPINAVVTDAQVEEPPVINRGDLVAVTVRSGAVTVTTQAVALGEARMGDAVRLRQPESKQQFEAIAAGPKRATIVLTPPMKEAKP